MILDPDEALTVQGSLISSSGFVVAPYDLEQAETGAAASGYRRLADPGVLNAASAPFKLDYARAGHVHVLNGMGVTLGDSIVGLTALAAIRHLHPDVRFTLYRPARAPDYVDALYRLAEACVAACRTLPWPLAALGAPDICLDVGNHLFWPDFMSVPMIDFFLHALGVDPATVDARLKANRWLADLTLPALPDGWATRPYVLLCAAASTPVRSIPMEQRARWAAHLADRFALPVLGFGPVAHPAYVDIERLSPDTAHFLAWIKGAAYVLTVDTAAVHIAAGFDVPTTAFFTTVAPDLRVRDYPRCRPVALALPALRNIQSSSRDADLALVAAAYRELGDADSMFLAPRAPSDGLGVTAHFAAGGP